MNEIITKLWNDEDFTFNKQLRLTFAQCDRNSNMCWSEILRFTSDGAGEDFTQRGMSWQFLQDKGIVFVVSRISFHVLKMPKNNQQITLVSWEEAAQGPLAVRRYKLIDTLTKETLITSYTLWTTLDLINKRILPAKAFDLRPIPTKVTDYDGIKPGKIPTPAEITKAGEHKVVFTDMDANGHVNNSKYINFALDVLPKEYQDLTIKDMRLNYSKEATYGEVIDLYTNIDKESNKITVIGKVADAVCFETEFYF